MKVQAILPLTTLLGAALAAPAPVAQQEGVSFPVTDVIDTGLTIKEYAEELEAGRVPEKVAPALTKRQYSSDTYNQLTDGTACRAVTVIWARGTTQEGNVGTPDSEGPTFFNALASRLGGTSRLAIQGVTYSASVLGFLAGGDAAGATTMFNLINTVSIQGSSKSSTYSECIGNQQVPLDQDCGDWLQPRSSARTHRYTETHSSCCCQSQRRYVLNPSRSHARLIATVVTFGDADRDETFGSVAASKVLIICHDGDNICDNGIIITAEHRNYEKDAPAAAAFVASKVA
jgi:cutinase